MNRRARKPIAEIPFSEIEAAFVLERDPSLPGPAVGRSRGEDGYYIRVTTSMAVNGSSLTSKFDYFYLDADGVVTGAPRGYAKYYKPARITGMDEAVAKYARSAVRP